MDENLKYWRDSVERMKTATGKEFCIIEYGHGDYQPWLISVADHLPPMAKVVYRTDDKKQGRVSLQEGMTSVVDRFNRVV